MNALGNGSDAQGKPSTKKCERKNFSKKKTRLRNSTWTKNARGIIRAPFFRRFGGRSGSAFPGIAFGNGSDARAETVNEKIRKEKVFPKKTRLRNSNRTKNAHEIFRDPFFRRCARDVPEKLSADLSAPIAAANPCRPSAMPENSAAGFQPDGGEQRQPRSQARTRAVDPVAKFPGINSRTKAGATAGVRGLPGGALGGCDAGKTVLASCFALLPPPAFSAIEYSLVRKNGLFRRLTDLRRQRGQCIFGIYSSGVRFP